MSDPVIDAVAICMQARLPCNIEGAPGTGKTSITKAIVGRMGETAHTVILSVRDATDQGGLPSIAIDPQTGEKYVVMVPPAWARNVKKDGKGVVIFDEFTTANGVVQNSALRVVNERYAGDTYLGDEVSFVLISNPPQYSVAVNELIPTMANRLLHFSWPFKPRDWTEASRKGFPAPEIPRVSSCWRELLQVYRIYYTEFLDSRPELALKWPEQISAQSGAWPSPRMWDQLAHALAAAESAGHGPKSKVASVLCDAAIGEGPAKEFRSWFVNRDLPDPESILSNPKGAAVPTRQDQQMVTLASVAATAVRPHAKLVERYRAAWAYWSRVCGDKPDVGFSAARILAFHAPAGIERDIPPEISKVIPLLQKSGINLG